MTDQTCMDVACPGKSRCTDPDCSLARANATYTASEVKVLTETAGEAGRRIGWKAAGEAIAEAMDSYPGNGQISTSLAALLARSMASQAAGATSDATSGVPGHPEVSEAVRSPQEPCGHPACPCASQEAR